MLLMTKRVREEIERLRRAGATEQEIKEWKKREAIRQSGLVDPMEGEGLRPCTRPWV